MKKIYYLGPAGSFSDILVHKKFPQDYDLIPMESFPQIVAQLQNEPEAIGMLGIENSISSSVHDNVDMMFKEHLKIIGEAYLQIQLNLIGLPGATTADITDVYSHQQALLQCSEFIKNHMLVTHKEMSTAAARDLIVNERNIHKAAIGSKALVTKDSTVLEEHIGNVKENTTRFIFVSQTESTELSPLTNKLTYIFKVKHEPGSLANVLTQLAKNQANLTIIESRPVPGSDFEYSFWVDLEVKPESVDTIQTVMKENTLEYTLIGAYQKGEKYHS